MNMKKIFYLLVVLAFSLTGRCQIHAFEQTSPARIQYHSERTAIMKVACIGDSITYGSGIEDRDNDSYPVQLQRLLGDRYQVANFGKPGATILDKGHRPYRQQKEYADAMAFAGDIAIIHMGANDTDPRNWPNYRDEFVHDYLGLIEDVRKANPEVEVYVCKVTPIFHDHRRFSSGTQAWHADINRLMETVAAASGSHLIDLYEPLHAHPDLFPDALHPNPEGARIIARTVCSAITGNYGGLKMPLLYTDNMVFQRNTPIIISGTADAGTTITVTLSTDTSRSASGFTSRQVYRSASSRASEGQSFKPMQCKEAVADFYGRWSVILDPMPASEHLTLHITATPTISRTRGMALGTEEKRSRTRKMTLGTEELIYRNVAFGEVWLCSGQSNMAFMVNEMKPSDLPDEHCEDAGLRLFNMKPRWNTDNVTWSDEALDSVRHLDYFETRGWEDCDRSSIDDFSAIAYHFGKMLRDSLQVPVGLICNAVGGSGIESWIDRTTLETKFPAILKDWKTNDFIQFWVRGRAIKNMGTKTPDADRNRRLRHPYEPCYLFESAISPLGRFPIKGVIWYQGESNAHNFEAHEVLFKLFTESWRSNWGDNELPVYFAQLSSLSRPSWPWFRDSQRRLAESIPHVGMIVTSDVGDSLNVHPKTKRPVGERFARHALSTTYGHHLTPTGPMIRSAVLLNEASSRPASATPAADGASGRGAVGDLGHAGVLLDFENGGGLQSSDAREISGFEVAEYDGIFYPARAQVVGDGQILLLCPQVAHPKLVSYAWKPFTRANLVNAEGLPASTFRIAVQ